MVQRGEGDKKIWLFCLCNIWMGPKICLFCCVSWEIVSSKWRNLFSIFKHLSVFVSYAKAFACLKNILFKCRLSPCGCIRLIIMCVPYGPYAACRPVFSSQWRTTDTCYWNDFDHSHWWLYNLPTNECLFFEGYSLCLDDQAGMHKLSLQVGLWKTALNLNWIFVASFNEYPNIR